MSEWPIADEDDPDVDDNDGGYRDGADLRFPAAALKVIEKEIAK